MLCQTDEATCWQRWQLDVWQSPWACWVSTGNGWIDFCTAQTRDKRERVTVFHSKNRHMGVERRALNSDIHLIRKMVENVLLTESEKRKNELRQSQTRRVIVIDVIKLDKTYQCWIYLTHSMVHTLHKIMGESHRVVIKYVKQCWRIHGSCADLKPVTSA